MIYNYIGFSTVFCSPHFCRPHATGKSLRIKCVLDYVHKFLVDTLVSLYKDQINKAIEFAEVPHNPEFQHFLALIHELKFDELRDYIAVLAGVSLTYYVVVKSMIFLVQNQ